MRRINLLAIVMVLVLTLPFTAAVAGQKKSGAGMAAGSAPADVAEITPAQLKNYLYFIADDVMEGRDTPSRGLDTVANFIAMNLERWGFKPAGDDPKKPFFQDIALAATKIDPERTTAELKSKNGPHAFACGKDFLAGSPGAAIGPLVYVGHGWVVKSKNVDAYQGVDIKDKIIIVSGNGLPKGVTFNDLRSGKPEVDWFTPNMYAAAHGAKGIVVVPEFRTLATWDVTQRNSVEHPNVSVAKFRDNQGAELPTIVASPAMLDELFRNEIHPASVIFNSPIKGDPVDPFELRPEKSLSFTVGAEKIEERTQNIVAVWEGSDPVLKNEYVAVGAHYDHVGMGQPSGGRMPSTKDGEDIIYNGADDDGSGTTALLAMAQELAHSPRPKRSVLFVWHCGEEKGLWGSRYFTDNPTIPLNQIIAQLNIDMIGRSKPEGDKNPLNKDLSGPHGIYVIGSKMMSTELGDLTASVNQSFLKLDFDYRYDDPHDPERFFYRSDHYNYAKHGVPIVFFFDGV
ncbi:MAG TPA: M20/M25/M40 family metallo-hydrolase, partial [Blastocatellia bacterium]|nr:M20/M25/M40 family metallo-hydrolase [Blastocatellia bacterium]